MREFFLEIAPSLLLMEPYDIARVVLGVGVFMIVLYVIITGVRMLGRVRPKRFFLHSSTQDLEAGDISHQLPKRRYPYTMAIALPVMILVATVAVTSEKSQRNEVASESDKIVFLGEQRVSDEREQPTPLVLGVEDGFEFLPQSENYRLATISVGGDTEIYLSREQNIPLEIYNISYRVMSEDNGEKTNMLINWRTNKPSQGSVFYRKHSDQDFRSKQEEENNVEHSLILENLEPETTYIFYVTGIDEWGQNQESEKYAMYSGERLASLFDLLEEAFGETFGWAMQGGL